MSNVNPKNFSMLTLKSFRMGLVEGFHDSFSTLKRAVNDLNVKLPKKVRELVDSESLPDSFEKFKANNNLADGIDSFTKWVDNAIKLVNDADDELFVVVKGPQELATITVTYNGKEATVADHAKTLLKGSKLAEVLAGQTPIDESLVKILNLIRNTCTKVVPEELRQKREKKSEKVEGQTITESDSNDDDD